MKKSIFVLIVLLAVLIVTCVYQKTYEIYSTSPKELTLIDRKSTTQSKGTDTTAAVEKEAEKTTIPHVASVPVATKPVAVKQVPAVKVKPEIKKEAEVKVVQGEKPVVKMEKAVVKEVKKEALPSAKNSAPVHKVPTVITDKTATPKPVAIQKSTSDDANKPAPTTAKSGEEEIVDYVMWAMKNRDIAMKNRDQVVARIHELITKALADRKVVLDERSKNEIELEKLQTEQIDARDASYESVINPKITNQGEK